jgi:hypothetical protein
VFMILFIILLLDAQPTLRTINKLKKKFLEIPQKK